MRARCWSGSTTVVGAAPEPGTRQEPVIRSTAPTRCGLCIPPLAIAPTASSSSSFRVSLIAIIVLPPSRRSQPRVAHKVCGQPDREKQHDWQQRNEGSSGTPRCSLRPPAATLPALPALWLGLMLLLVVSAAWGVVRWPRRASVWKVKLAIRKNCLA
jgi:hypothetical protein